MLLLRRCSRIPSSWSHLTKNPTGGESGMTYSADATEEYQRRNHSLQEVSGYFAVSGPDNLKLIGKERAACGYRAVGGRGFFHTLGVEPVLGASSGPRSAYTMACRWRC